MLVRVFLIAVSLWITDPSSATSAASAALPARGDAVAAGGATGTATGDTAPPVDTINEFFPEDRSLGDCLSSLPKPGCGSSARGGWRQTLVLVASLGRSRLHRLADRGPIEKGAGMTPDEFRRNGYEMIDLIADYLEGVEDRRIVPDIEPGDVRAMLPEHPPTEPEPWDAIRADIDRGRAARHHALAAPQLVRLLSRQHDLPVDPR